MNNEIIIVILPNLLFLKIAIIIEMLFYNFLQLQIYSSSTHQVNKSFTRFKGKVYCGSFRHDGKLLVTGEENGTVQVLQMFLR